jgi:hypothetical protein
LHDNDVAACTIMAELSEKIGDVAAVTWRQRVVEILPDSADARERAAVAAVRFGRNSAAREALDGVRPEDRKGADYLSAAGQVAVTLGKDADAEKYYSEALQIAPKNQHLRYALAKLQAGSPDYFTREAGRNLLDSLASDPEFTLTASRTLIKSFRSTGEFEAALHTSTRLVASPQHRFADLIMRMSLLLATENPTFPAELAKLKDSASHKPIEAAALLSWMISAGLAREGVTWATKETPAVGEMPEIQPPLIAGEVALADWTAVLQLTESQISPGTEYLRHAYRARALREQAGRLMSQSEWQAALSAAGRSSESLRWLASTAAEWNWQEEEEQTLWAVTEKVADSAWALKRLARRYSAAGNTEALRKVAARILQSDPANEDAQNDFALLSLLTMRESQKAETMARTLYQKHRQNAAFASTYAFALHLKGESREAQQILDGLPAPGADDQSLAAYYAIILAANHDAQAARYASLAKGAHLLPEEKRLLSEAAASSGASEAGAPRPIP